MTHRTFSWKLIPLIFLLHLAIEILVVYNTAHKLPEFSIFTAAILIHIIDLPESVFPPTLTKPKHSQKYSKATWRPTFTTCFSSNSQASSCSLTFNLFHSSY